MSRTGHGRYRQFQRVTRIRPPRAPAAIFAAHTCETFTGPDGNLGTVTTDLSWSVQSGQEPVVSANQCTTAGAGTTGTGRVDSDTASTNQFVECDWTAAAQNDVLQLFAREGTEGGANLFGDEKIVLYLAWDGTDEVTVDLKDYQSNDMLATQVVLTPTTAVATWRLEVDGDVVRGYRNGVLVITGDATGYAPAGTKAGFEIDPSFFGPPLATIDNFCFGDL